MKQELVATTAVVGTSEVGKATWVNPSLAAGADPDDYALCAALTIATSPSRALDLSYAALPTGTVRGMEIVPQTSGTGLSHGTIQAYDSGAASGGGPEDFTWGDLTAIGNPFYDWQGDAADFGFLRFRAVRNSGTTSTPSIATVLRRIWYDKEAPDVGEPLEAPITLSAESGSGVAFTGLATYGNRAGAGDLHADFPANQTNPTTKTLRLNIGVDSVELTAPYGGSERGSTVGYIRHVLRVKVFNRATSGNAIGRVRIASCTLVGPGSYSRAADDCPSLSGDGLQPSEEPIDIADPTEIDEFGFALLWDGTGGALPSRAQLVSGECWIEVVFQWDVTADTSDPIRLWLQGAANIVTASMVSGGAVNTPAAAFSGSPLPAVYVPSGDGTSGLGQSSTDSAYINHAIFRKSNTFPIIPLDARSTFDENGIRTHNGQSSPYLQTPYDAGVGFVNRVKRVFGPITAGVWPASKPKRVAVWLYGPEVSDCQLKLVTHASDAIAGIGISWWMPNGIAQTGAWFAATFAVIGELMASDPSVNHISVVEVQSQMETSVDVIGSIMNPFGDCLMHPSLDHTTDDARWATDTPIRKADGTTRTMAQFFADHAKKIDGTTDIPAWDGTGFAQDDALNGDIFGRAMGAYTECWNTAHGLAIFGPAKDLLPTFDSGQVVKCGTWGFAWHARSRANQTQYGPHITHYCGYGLGYKQDHSIPSNYGAPEPVSNDYTLAEWYIAFPPAVGIAAVYKPMSCAKTAWATHIPQLIACGGSAAAVCPYFGTDGVNDAVSGGGSRSVAINSFMAPTYAALAAAGVVKIGLFMDVPSASQTLSDFNDIIGAGNTLITGETSSSTQTGIIPAMIRRRRRSQGERS